jgi:hypothetical protein
LGRLTAQPSRRTFIVGATATAGLGAFASGAVSARAQSTPKAGPAPSMTTTSGAPKILAAHCGLLGLPIALPVVREQHMQVSAVMSEPSMVKARAWPAGNPSAATESAWTETLVGTDPSNPVNVAKFWMPPGIGAAGTGWDWQVFTAPVGSQNDPGSVTTDGVVRSIPSRPADGVAAAFAFAVGSCSQIAHPGTPDRPVLSAANMAEEPIAFMAHLGDTSYVDTWSEYLQDTNAHLYTKFATGLRHHLTQPDIARLYERVPVRMVIDDHESGPDNSYAADVYPQARQVFTDIGAGTTFDNASYDLLHPKAPTYDTWVIGQTQFWLLDNRLWRDDPKTKPQSFNGQAYASQLGVTQRAWLKASLAASSAPIKIILTPRTFTQFYAGGEQQELIDWITGFRSHKPMVSGTVVFLSGDMHAGGVWRLSPTRPVYEMLCGPMLNTTLHSPKALSSWQVKWGYQTRFLNTASGLPGRAISNAWGLVSISANDQVTLDLMKDDGTLLYQEIVRP